MGAKRRPKKAHRAVRNLADFIFEIKIELIGDPVLVVVELPVVEGPRVVELNLPRQDTSIITIYGHHS